MRLFHVLLLGCLILNKAFGLGVGDRVKTNATTSVRVTPGGGVAGTQTSGSTGIVVGGPNTAILSGTSTSYTWWNVNFDTNMDGWVVSTALVPDATGQYSDLMPQNLALSPLGGLPGSSVQVGFTVINKGLSASLATTVSIRLSTSPSSLSTGGPLLGSVPVDALAPGAQRSFFPSFLIPSGTAAGQWYVWVLVDPGLSAHQGTLTINDRANTLFTVYATGQNSDLVPQSLSLAPSAGPAGSGVQLAFKVVNNGAAASLATTAEIRLGPSSLGPDSEGILLGSVSIGPLAAGAQGLFSPGCSIPADTLAGLQYVWIVIDPSHSANQGARTGNDRIKAAFTVTGGATLSWRLPLNGPWAPARDFAAPAPTETEPDRLHLGQDISRTDEAAVYAAADGVVKFNAPMEPYGRVLVLEHQLAGGARVCSVYGHLRQAGSAPAETQVVKGALIGYLESTADDSEESGTHLHFGIRMGAFSTALEVDGQWRYREYGPPDVAASWYDPLAFISQGGSLNASAPAISPAGGTFALSAELALSAGTLGATIRYTLDGSAPTAASPVYTGPFTLERSATLKARAFATGYGDSPVSSADFVIQVPVLSFHGLDQTYDGTPRFVTVSGVPEGHAATLTYDGSLTAPIDAGSYAIVANLDGHRQTARLTVRKKPLQVAALSTSRLVGEPNPEPYTLVYDGFVEGETEADLAPTRPVAKTKAARKSAQGDYPITVSGGTDKNYAFVPASPPGMLSVLGFGGTYEALLVDEALTPLGKLTLTVANNALSYSGTVTLASAAKATSFKSTAETLLSAQEDGSVATGALLITVATADPDIVYDLTLGFTLSANGSLAGGLFHPGLGEIPPVTVATLLHGAHRVAFAKGTPAPGAGANTLALRPAYNLFEDGPLPGGSGHATAGIAASTGVLTLKGKVADGQTLTASLKPTLEGYLLWANPYGTRTESFLAGLLALQPHPDQIRFEGRSYIPGETGLLIWQKHALPETTPAAKRDKSCRAGFGPLGVQVSLDPWLPPSTKAVILNGVAIPAGTLVQRLGLASSTPPGVFALAYGPESLDLGDSGDALPAEAALAANGSLTVADASATSWTIKLTPATGAFSGSFVLHDEIDDRTAVRKVTFSGTLRQTTDDTTLGAGCFLLPGFAKTEEQLSGEIRFTAPPPVP